MPDDCLFCSMASGAVPVDKIYDEGAVFAIRDINPRAPVHVLVIPRAHIATAADLSAEDGPLLASMHTAARAIAQLEGLADRGYRCTINVGDDGGQTIHHLHMHVLGGRRLGAEG